MDNNSKISVPIRKSRFSVSYRKKKKERERESFSIKQRNSFSKEKNNTECHIAMKPISILFKKEPKTLELLKTIKIFKEINAKNNGGNGGVKKTEKNEEHIETKNKNIIDNIVRLIKNHRGLYNIFSYYKIDDKTLYKLAPIINYRQKEKNTYIWEENDNSTKIYFLLKGQLSFRKNVGHFQEKEKLTLNENNIFGMLDIIYERKRKLSCFCITDCTYLSIEKEFFKKFMEEKVNKTEAERKTFLVRFFNSFITIPLIKLERFITNHTEILFFGKNDIIFREGDDNKCLYIIFNGEANLMKNISKGEFFVLTKFNQSIERIKENAKNIDYINIIKNNNNKKEGDDCKKLDFILNKSDYKVISTLSKGCIGGLEIATGMTKFKYNLVSNCNFCVVIKINLEFLEDEHLKMFMINLLPVFIRNEKKIHFQIKKIKYIDNIYPPSCRKYKDMSNLINDTNQIEEEEENKNKNIADKKIYNNRNSPNIINTGNSTNNNNINVINISINDNENDKTYKKIIQKIDDKFDTNEGGFIKMNNFNINLCKKKYFLKEQIKDNRRRDIKILNFIKKYKKERNNDLKSSSVKMNYILSDPNKKQKKNFHEIILSKNKNNISNCFNHTINTKRQIKSTKHEMKMWHFPSPHRKKKNLNLNINTNFFKNIIKNNNNKNHRNKNALSAKLTKKQYQKRINEIFEDYYNKMYLKKDYSKQPEDTEDHKLISIQLIKEKEDSLNKLKKMSFIRSDEEDDFIKEIIVFKGKEYKDEATNTITYDVSERININNNSNNHNANVSMYNNDKKSITQFSSINDFKTLSLSNKENNKNNKNEEKIIKIVNNKYIRDLFYKNSDNNNRCIDLKKNCKFRKARKNLFKEITTDNNINNNNNYRYKKNRIILYDTGHFDMPLATKLYNMK